MTTEKLSAFTASTPALSDYVAGATAGSPNKKFQVSNFTPAVKATSDLNFYVATTGSDTNPGTIGSPFLTIQHALSVAASFDYQGVFVVKVNIAAGTYDVSANGIFLPPIVNGIGPIRQDSNNPSGWLIGAGATLTTLKLVAQALIAWGSESVWTLKDLQWDFGQVSFVQAIQAWNDAVIYVNGSHQSIDTTNTGTGQVLGAWNGGTINFNATWTFASNFNTFLFGGNFGMINVNTAAHLVFPPAQAFGYFFADLQTGPMFISFFPGSIVNPATFTGQKLTISGGLTNVITPNGTFDTFPGSYGNGNTDAMTFINSQTTFGGPYLPINGGPPASNRIPRDTISYWKDATNGPRSFIINDNGVLHTKQIGRFINVQTGNYTIQLFDQDGRIEMNSGGANTLTIPQDSAFSGGLSPPVGTEIRVVQTGAGATTISAGAGATVNNSGVVGGQWKSVVVYKTAANTWNQVNV